MSQCSHQHHLTIIWQLWKAGLLCINWGINSGVYPGDISGTLAGPDSGVQTFYWESQWKVRTSESELARAPKMPPGWHKCHCLIDDDEPCGQKLHNSCNCNDVPTNISSQNGTWVYGYLSVQVMWGHQNHSSYLNIISAPPLYCPVHGLTWTFYLIHMYKSYEKAIGIYKSGAQVMLSTHLKA